MNRKHLASGAAAGIIALALALSGCGTSTPTESAPPTQPTDPTSSASAAPGIVSFASNEPQHPLIPAITNEVGGGLALQNLFAMPIYYEADGSVKMDTAESITSDDGKTWTIKLRPGLKFSDGSPLTASNYAKAWQYAASDPEFENQWWFENWEGYTDEEVKEESLAIAVVDDTTLTVTLSAPQADFAMTLGYTVFAPVPDSFFADPEAFGASPIGNGPYALESWEHDVSINMLPNPNYDGPRKPQNGGIELRAYATQDAAYVDALSDNLDLLQQVPAVSLGKYKDDFGARAIDQGAAIWQGLTIPKRLAHFADDEEGLLRRQAISYAINREEVCNVIFQGTRSPAREYTSPVIAGYNDAIPGSEVTHFNADKAKELWAQADAISPWDGSFVIAYNADGGHEPWVTAVTNQLKNTLGIDAKGQSFPDFATLRTEIKNRTIQAATRSGWQFDYPGPYNILGALYITGAGSNDGDYSSAAYDELVQKGATAPTLEESAKLLEQAQEQLFKDLPVLPLWYQSVNAGYSNHVGNVGYGWDSWPVLYQITKTANN
ncbi:MAG: ABC transporter substrate-binding protein [Propionibacteriaceae bacterium]|nr:ABC transporter substrate-binding protein [Propionibacteriaceae bacterium]